MMDERESLLARIAALEADVAELKRRSAEGPASAAQEPPPLAPPVLSAQPRWVYAGGAAEPRATTDEPSPKPRDESGAGVPKESLETRIGARLLPLVGGSLFVLAFSFLVAYAIERGWIDLRAQFIGELLLSGLFVVVGLFQFRRREEFGQLLAGIGSAGFFLSVAGAHVFKGLLDGNQLLVAFTVLAVLNIAFAAWRSSPAFWGLGFAGGIIAACLPLTERQFGVHAVLLGLAVVVGGAAIVRNRWPGIAVVQAFVVMLCTLFVTPDWAFGRHDAPAVYLLAMALAGAVIVRAAQRPDRAPTTAEATVATVCVLLPPAFNFFVNFDFPGTFFADSGPLIARQIALVLAFSGLLCVIGLSGQKSGFRGGYLGTAVFTAAVFGPAWLVGVAEVFTYCGVAVLLALSAMVAHRFDDRVEGARSFLRPLAAGIVALAIGGYLAEFTRDAWPTPAVELAVIAAMMTALGALATTLHWGEDAAVPPAPGWAVIVAIGSLLLARAVYLPLGPHGLGWPQDLAVLVSLMSVALAVSFCGALRRDPAVTVGAVVPFAIAVVTYLDLFQWRGRTVVLDPWVDLALLAAAGAFLVLAASPRLANSDWIPRRAALSLALAAGSFVAARFVFVVLDPVGGLPSQIAIPLALLVASAIVAMGAPLVKSSGLAVWAALLALWAGAAYLNVAIPGLIWVPPPAAPVQHEIVVVALMIATVLTIAASARRLDSPQRLVQWVTAVCLWPLGSQLLYLLEQAAATGLPYNAVVSGSWAVYAALVLAIGFVVRAEALRFVSLALFGLTASKVILFDLTRLDPAVRIGLLMLVGLVMLGMGYVYNRVQARARETEGAGPEPDLGQAGGKAEVPR